MKEEGRGRRRAWVQAVPRARRQTQAVREREGMGGETEKEMEKETEAKAEPEPRGEEKRLDIFWTGGWGRTSSG